jgi:hypothetical protein
VYGGLNRGKRGREDPKEERGIIDKRVRNVEGELFLYEIG